MAISLLGMITQVEPVLATCLDKLPTILSIRVDSHVYTDSNIKLAKKIEANFYSRTPNIGKKSTDPVQLVIGYDKMLRVTVTGKCRLPSPRQLPFHSIRQSVVTLLHYSHHAYHVVQV